MSIIFYDRTQKLQQIKHFHDHKKCKLNFYFVLIGEIKTIRVLDRETDPTYEITVRANDSVNSATATVTVQVLDKNDNEPKFSRHVPG